MTHVGALVLRNLSRFFHSARMPLSEFPGLAATVRNRDRMTTTRTGQTSHAFRKPSRRNRSPPCWTCGSWLMCFACKSETVKTTQDMKDRCGKHMNTSIKKLMDSIIITVDYRLWDVSLVAMIEMIEIFWEAKLLFDTPRIGASGKKRSSLGNSLGFPVVLRSNSIFGVSVMCIDSSL